MTRVAATPSGGPVPLAGVLGVAVAAALVPLNSTMIAVALPSIGNDFYVSTAHVSLLVTLYLVVMLVGQPLAGRLADAVGSRRTVRFALLGLAAFSALAVFAGSFTTSRYVGSITTTILIAALVTDDAAGTRTVLSVSVACMVVALVVARWLPGRIDAPRKTVTAVAP